MVYERFTDRVRRVLDLAREEANCCGHDAIETEDIVVALANDNSNVAICVLRSFDLDQAIIRAEAERLVSKSDEQPKDRYLPLSTATKRLLESAMREARALTHDYVGTEHLLLGAVSEQECTGAQVLLNLGASIDDVRNNVLSLLGHVDSTHPADQ